MGNRKKPTPTQEIPRLWNKREFATYYGVSEATVDAWVASGKVTPLRTPSGRPRFHPPENANATVQPVSVPVHD